MAAVPINQQMLVLARESRGLSQSELAERLGVSQARLSRIESGLATPTDELMETLASTLSYPRAFFVAQEPILGPGVSDFFHRRRQKITARHLSRIHAEVNVRRLHIERMLRSADLTDESIPRLHLDEFGGSPTQVAQAVRHIWNVPSGPIHNLTEMVEDHGGIVSECNFGTMQVDEVSVWPPGLPPLFFMNSEFPADRKRLTLAHALGHMVMHDVPTPTMEQEASEFAAEFLMPGDEIRDSLVSATLHKLATLKPYWRVSMAALLKRASDLKCITDSQSRMLWIAMSKAGYRRTEPSEFDIEPEEPTLLAELLQYHREELGYSLSDLGSVLRADPAELVVLYGQRPGPGDESVNIRLMR